MYKVIDNQDRNKLNEGRNYQMGFAFCKRTNNTFETVQPISPCKDYLNDVVYAGIIKKKVSAYGLEMEPHKLFDDNKCYISIKICLRTGGLTYNNYLEDKENLKNNYKNIAIFLNHFETLLGN